MKRCKKKFSIKNNANFDENSVSLLLSTAKSEYDNEHNRTSVIDSKTNISLPIITAFFLALVQLNDYKYIFRLPTNTFFHWLLPATLFFSYTCALVLGAVSVYFMTRVIFAHNYKTLKTRDLYDIDFLKSPALNFSIQLIKLYCECSEFNKTQNDKRIRLYKYSWIIMFITLCLYLVYIIVKTSI